MKEKKDLSLIPVPENERVGWRAPLFNILGSNVAISELMIGGTLIAGMNFSNLVITSVVGNLILVAILCIQGYIGSKEGLNTYVISKSVFGNIGGKWIISAILAITSFGWFGIQAGVAGLSVQKIFPQLNLMITTIVLGLLMMIFAILGFSAMAKFNYIAVPPLVLLMIWGLYRSISTYGLEPIVNYVPQDTISLIEGINMVVGLIIVGAIISPDQLRFTRNLKDVFMIGLIGFALISVFQQIAAGVLAMGSPSWDITEVLANLGFGNIAFVILLLAAWSTNVSNAYSGGLALKTIFPNAKRELLTLIAGLVGTIVAASGIIFRFNSFLSILSMAVSPLAGIIWVDYYLLNKQKLLNREGVNFIALTVWLVGSIGAYYTTQLNIGIPPINGIIISGILYYGLKKLIKKH